jgi:hypothetical protein
MKASIYTIESNALKATISKGVQTKFNWLLEVKTKCGGQLISYKYQVVFLTKQAAVAEFNKLKNSPFAIKS